MSWRFFWDWVGHPGGESLQSPPMPEKPIISQVSPSGACSTECTGPGGCRLRGFQCEGWIYLEDQDLPTGWHRSQPTADTASSVSHPK